MVLSASSLTHAGKPMQIGGALVRAFGWLSLLAGLGLGALVALLVGLVATPTAGLITFAVFALCTGAWFWLLNQSGKKLESEGDETRDLRREQALDALAMNNRGVLVAAQAASALDLPLGEADDFLTHLAKTRPDEVGVELGDRGEVFYTFARHLSRSPSQVASPRDRVRVASAPTPRAAEPQQIIDAEFEPVKEEHARR